MKNIVLFAVMAASINYVGPAQAQLTGNSAATTKQTESKPTPRETKYNGVQQNPGNRVTKLLARNDFPTVVEIVELFKQHPRAVSIAIRLSKPTDFASALQIYRAAFAAVPGSDATVVTDAASESYKVLVDDRQVELLVTFQNNQNFKTDCVIIYTPLDATIDTRAEMNDAFKKIIDSSHGRFRSIERPTVSLRGSRDDRKPKKAYRAVYEIVTSNAPPSPSTEPFLLIGKVYEGVIINPPIP